jgi:hypothetical protein
MEKITTKYVLQNADGQFYWKDKSVSSLYGFTDDFGKAYIFDSEKGAKTRLYLAGDGGVIRPVVVGLLSQEPVYIPSVWIEGDIKNPPSKMSAASYNTETGEYSSYTKYYDSDGNEISEKEYEALIRQPQD